MTFYDLKTGAEQSAPASAVYALGNFDGVHIAHKALITEAVRLSRAIGAKAGIWTFSRHPQLIVGTPFKILTPSADRLGLCADAGARVAAVEDFSAVRGLSPEGYVDYLINACNARAVVCGYNFRFGHGGEGNAKSLVSLFEKKGGRATVLPMVISDGEAVSSSAIRAYLESGKPESAAKMLGRDFFINLPVVHGEHLGTRLGYPTINQVFPPEMLVPRHGVYAVTVEADGKTYGGAANVGVRPTVDGSGAVNCEAYIFGFSGSLYGKTVRLCFKHFVRDEKKFNSTAELSEAIKADVAACMSLLSPISD